MAVTVESSHTGASHTNAIDPRATYARTVEHTRFRPIHPLHAVLLAGAVPLFLGAALSDVVYARTFHIQWQNFASWLVVGGLVFAGVALVFAIFELFRADRAPGLGVYTAVLFVAWVVGFFNALIHARDAWASMPMGLVLSVIATALVCAATWLGFRTRHIGGTP